MPHGAATPGVANGVRTTLESSTMFVTEKLAHVSGTPASHFGDGPAPERHHDFLPGVVSCDEPLRLPDEH